MIEMIPIKIDHEVVGVVGSIPLDGLFVEELGRHKKQKIKFLFCILSLNQ